MSGIQPQIAVVSSENRSARLSQTLRLTEIYKSIQGESTWAGLPCTFVRLARCNLRCVWCDTAYAFYGGETVSIAHILERCEELGSSLVEITGGEPLAQKACPLLAESLIEGQYTVLVETSGSLPIRMLPEGVIVIMDLKCPDSGECDKNHLANIDDLKKRDEVKFVLASRRDYEWARELVRERSLAARCNAVIFSPAYGWIQPKAIAEWILEDDLSVRLQVQLHKCVWPPDQRGV